MSKLGMGKRSTSAVVMAFALLLATACATPPAGGGGTPEPPAAAAVLSPTSGIAGSFVDVAPPDDHCLGPAQSFKQLQATLTIRSSGIIVAYGYAFIGQSLSTNVNDDPFVHLRIPPVAAPGQYLVYLTCQNYLDSYQYSPAGFTVTSV